VNCVYIDINQLFLVGFSNVTPVFTSRQKIDQGVFQIAFLK